MVLGTFLKLRIVGNQWLGFSPMGVFERINGLGPSCKFAPASQRIFRWREISGIY